MIDLMKSSESDLVQELAGEDGGKQGLPSMLSQRRARTVVSKFKVLSFRNRSVEFDEGKAFSGFSWRAHEHSHLNYSPLYSMH